MRKRDNEIDARDRGLTEHQRSLLREVDGLSVEEANKVGERANAIQQRVTAEIAPLRGDALYCYAEDAGEAFRVLGETTRRQLLVDAWESATRDRETQLGFAMLVRDAPNTETRILDEVLDYRSRVMTEAVYSRALETAMVTAAQEQRILAIADELQERLSTVRECSEAFDALREKMTPINKRDVINPRRTPAELQQNVAISERYLALAWVSQERYRHGAEGPGPDDRSLEQDRDEVFRRLRAVAETAKYQGYVLDELRKAGQQAGHADVDAIGGWARRFDRASTGSSN